ncbi:MAG: DUF11 domain-containing protein, partial [Anaerolineales bacterium]|nr:DUF11 domain-containing protein [Anaerolineales bacterium]
MIHSPTHARKKALFPVTTTLLLIAALLQPQAGVLAAVTLTVTPITWNVVGLDSNDPLNSGPENFPIGVQICNMGGVGETATGVTAQLVWDSANPHIALRENSQGWVADGTTIPVQVGTGTLAGGNTCQDVYFEVTVSRLQAAFDTTRRYHIVVASNETAPVSTPTPREIYVERLISQSRNSTTDVLLDGQSVAPGGTMALTIGGTYNITLIGKTATNGYEQIESFINFPNTIFRINSVATSYTAPAGATSDRLYGDGCTWENDPDSLNYRSCLGVGKYGGNVTINYNVTIIGGGGTVQNLTNLIYDFSGSSYHYNADFSFGARLAAIIDPTSVTIDKSFTPSPTQVNTISTLSFTLANPNGAVLEDVHFTDTFPTFPAAMVTYGTTYTASGCGTPTVRAPIGGAGYASGQPSVAISNVTIAAYGSCMLSIQVTAPSTGTYDNATSNLFVGTVDTGDDASASLVMNTAPAPPPCTPGVLLARWDFTSSLLPTYQSPGVSTATASYGGNVLSTVPDTQNGQVGWSLTSISGSWPETASPPPGYPLYGAEPYFQFLVDTTNFSDVQITYDVDVEGNWANANNNYIYVWSNANGGSFGAATGTGAVLNPVTKTNWYLNNTAVAATTGSSTTAFRFNELGAKATGTAPRVVLDNVIITGCGFPDYPTISKSFSPGPVAVGGTSTLTFTITNPNPYAALSGIAFNDTLPPGLTVTTSGPTLTCGGSLNTTAPDMITFTGGTLAAGASCTLTGVTVTANTPGPHVNISGNISSDQTGTNYGPGGTAAASLTAIQPPQIDKLFGPNPIVAGGISTLTFTITNPNQDDSLSGVAFTDLLPAGVTVSGAVTTPQCGGGAVAVTNVGGRDQIALTGGSIIAGESCTVTVDTTSAITGTYANTSGNVSATTAGVGNTAADTLTVTATHPGISILKQVSPTGSDPWTSFVGVPLGGTVHFRFIIENIGDVTLTNVTVTDPGFTMPDCSWVDGQGASLPDVFPLPPADADEQHLAYCVLGPFPVTTADSFTNTATVDSDQTGPESDSATYATTGLTLEKSAAESYYTSAGQVLHYSYVVTNSGYAQLAGPVTIDDDLSVDEFCPAVNTAVQTAPPGSGNGDNFLDRGESITCSATYTVVMGDLTAGSITNTALATTGGVDSNEDSVTIPVRLPDLRVVKGNNTSDAGVVGATFNWVLTITNAGDWGAAFTDGQTILRDSLPANATYGLPTTGTFTDISNSANISCSIDASDVLTCVASGADVTIGAVTGSFVVTIPATPTASGPLPNTATVDPDAQVLEVDEGNNTSSNTVTVALVNPALTLVKGIASGDPYDGVGDVVSYTFLV